MSGVELARATRDHIVDLIKFADAKAGAVLLLATAVLSGVLTAAFRQLDGIAKMPEAAHRCLALVALAVPTLVVIACAAAVARHVVRTLSPNVSRAHASYASFPDIAVAPLDGYLGLLRSCDQAIATEELGKHSHVLARIAKAKFDSIAQALTWTGGLIVASLVFVVAWAAVAAVATSVVP